MRRWGVGRFPQGQEAVAASLQGLLFFFRNLALQRQGIFLVALDKGRALHTGIRRSFWLFAILGMDAAR